MESKEAYLSRLSRYRRLGNEAEQFIFVLGSSKCSPKVGRALLNLRGPIVVSGVDKFELSLAKLFSSEGRRLNVWVKNSDDFVLDEIHTETSPFGYNQIDDILVTRCRLHIFVGTSDRISRAQKYSNDLGRKNIQIDTRGHHAKRRSKGKVFQ
mgnify:FL=1